MRDRASARPPPAVGTAPDLTCGDGPRASVRPVRGSGTGRNVDLSTGCYASSARDGLDESADVPVAERVRLSVVGVVWVLGDVVGHEHPVVADLAVDLQGAVEVDVAVVGVALLEVVAAPVDVAEVDVEDL